MAASHVYLMFHVLVLREEYLQTGVKNCCVLDKGTFQVHKCVQRRGIRERVRTPETILCSHFNGVCHRALRAGGDGAFRHSDGITTATGSIGGTNAGGRVSSGANKAGHTCCGHYGVGVGHESSIS